MPAQLRPQDVHSVWLLLKGLASGDRKDLRSQANETLGVDDDEEIARLISIAVSLHLVSSPARPVIFTPHGKTFVSAPHWRLWTIPVDLTECFAELGIDALFLGTGSWELRPGVFDLFAGAGGFSLAFESAGFAIKAAIDNDSHACQALEQNFPNCKVICEDMNRIADGSGSTLQAILGADLGGIVGVIGSPPCQGFSNIGEKLDNDS